MRILKRLGTLGVLLTLVHTFANAQISPVRVRVLTYNIHHGAGTDGKLDLPRIADVIKSAVPDLVALQEVDYNTERTQKADQAAELGRLTGMHARFGRAFDFSGGQYGAALLSRWPFQSTIANTLPGSPGHETRPALQAKVRPPGGEAELALVSVHLDHLKEEERLTQVTRLLELLENDKALPTIVAGDLNAVPETPVLGRFKDHWLNTTAGHERLTSPSYRPTRQIDYILCRPKDRWRVVETKVITSAASDHAALLAILELKAP